MTTTLSEGVKVPDVGSTDWADDLETNWNLLNTALAQQGSWAKIDEAQTFTGVQTFSDGIVGSLQGTANMAMSDADGNTITSTYATKTELSTLSDTVGTKANDADVVHKADAETITGAKTFSATVTSADVVPSATDTYSLGSASYQYNGIYSKSYFYNGVAWGLDRENTWTAIQTFTARPVFAQSQDNAEITFRNLNFDPVTSGQASISSTYTANFVARNSSNGTLGSLSFIGISSLTITRLTARYYTSASASSEEYVQLIHNGSICQFTPRTTGITDLGTSTNKWKSLNGVNPGALSLPGTSYTTIDTSEWVLDGETSIEYTPLADGYMTLANGPALEWVRGQIIGDYNVGIYRFVYKYDTDVGGFQGITIPCIKGKRVVMRIKGTSFFNSIFVPCQGNV